VVYSWTPDFSPWAGIDLRMQWVRPDGSFVFPRAGLTVADAPQWDVQGAIVPHPEAGVFVAFVQGDPDYDSRVVLQRYDGQGRRLWPRAGVAAVPSSSIEIQTTPYLVPDAQGGAYVCFMRLPDRSPASTVVCQHFDESGRRLWSKQGRDAGGVPGLRREPQAMPDGQGGLLVFWHNDRSNEEPRLRMLIEGQRLSRDGSRLWGSRGHVLHRTHLVKNGSFEFREFDAVPDGAGGAVLAFEDQIGEDLAVLAQRVNGEGTPLWGPGVQVAAGLPVLDSLVAAPAGGTFALLQEEHKVEGRRQQALTLYRLDGDGNHLWPGGVQVAALDQTSSAALGAFDGARLWVLWQQHPIPRAPHLSEMRLLTLDLNGNRLNGLLGEALSQAEPGHFSQGLFFDSARGQGLAVWMTYENAFAELFGGSD